MITVVTLQERPNTDVPFYIETVPEISSAFAQFIANTPHLIEPPSYALHNDRNHVTVAKYASHEDLQAFLAELEVLIPSFFEMRDSYNRLNNISVTRNVVES
jgi:hypothetical protein